jgi:hypothetical protein
VTTGLVKVRGYASSNSLPEKRAEAVCPAGKKVVGGGGGLVWVTPDQHPREVVLTAMYPVDPIFYGEDRFVVIAQETATGTTDNWALDAYAMCADPLPGQHIVAAWTTPSSASVQLAQAHCPAGEVVIGSGGYTNGVGGQVGLQVVRASMNETYAYAQAHEDADGWGGTWNVWSWAVCADRPSGYEIVHGASAADDSEAEKDAAVLCTGNRRIHSAGAAITFVAPGSATLSRVLPDPYGTGRQANALAIENTPTSADWDFIVVQAICAY